MRFDDLIEKLSEPLSQLAPFELGQIGLVYGELTRNGRCQDGPQSPLTSGLIFGGHHDSQMPSLDDLGLRFTAAAWVKIDVLAPGGTNFLGRDSCCPFNHSIHASSPYAREGRAGIEPATL